MMKLKFTTLDDESKKLEDGWNKFHAICDSADKVLAEGEKLIVLNEKILACHEKLGFEMQIIESQDEYGWITVIIEGRWVQAKVFNEPSTFGINNGRVSKCTIGKTDARDPTRDYFSQLDYNYDRGLDFDYLPDGLLDKIVVELEALPLRVID